MDGCVLEVSSLASLPDYVAFDFFDINEVYQSYYKRFPNLSAPTIAS